MKQTKLYAPTLKSVSKQAVAQSHILALRAGMIHQTAAGLYSYLPLSVMMLNKIEAIIKEELQNIGANEVILPLLEPAELWEATGRWQSYGSELFRVQDRRGSKFALAPTHEEVMTELVKNNLKSYKNYPLNLFQIGTKFRDEARPRFGLLRGREFVMMDGYSFHTSDEDLMSTYNDYYRAYENIFTRLGLDFKIVQADNGSMGGNSSHEFMALAEIGEDTIAYDPEASIAYNTEIAPIYYEKKAIDSTKQLPMEKIYTPNIKTISELVKNTNFDIEKIVKTVAYLVDEKLVFALVRGDREVNDVKVLNYIGGNEINLANDATLEKNGLISGFLGPIDCNVKVLIDNEVEDIVNGIVGANEKDYHYTNVNIKRDVSKYEVIDIRLIEKGDIMIKGGNPCEFKQGIEIGHIFALGKKYTEALDVKYLTKEQKLEIPTMGCYGIGVSRLLSAIFEQNHDENGLILPKEIAPFDIHLVALDYQKNEEQAKFVDELYKLLEDNGFSILLDDRDERPGTKFADSELIGLPITIIVGRSYIENKVEVKFRKNSSEKQIVEVNNLLEVICD